VLALAFSPVTDLLAASYAYEHGTILLYDGRTGQAQGRLTNHTIAASALVFTPDGSQLVSASADATIRVWNVADRTQLGCLQSAREELTALAMLPDGKTLVSGGQDGSVCFWDATASNRPPAHTAIQVSADADAYTELEPSSYTPGKLDPRVVRRLGVAFTPDSRRFITFDAAGALALWETYPTQLIEKLAALGGNHWGVALSPDGRWLATGESLGTITIWDWPARRVVTQFISPFEWFCAMRFSRSGHYLSAIDFNNQLVTRARLWRTTDWSEVPLKEGQLAGAWKLDVSPDDRFLAAGYADGKVKLFRLPLGETEAVFTGHPSAVSGLCFSSDGRSLASMCILGSARLWDVVARRELTPAPLPGRSGVIRGAALSPDGRRWATGGYEPTEAVKLWDPGVHRELLTLRGSGRFFVDVNFSPDGNTVVASGRLGFANLWHAPSWEDIEAAEKRQKAQ
jgi:WD40 repeat protein